MSFSSTFVVKTNAVIRKYQKHARNKNLYLKLHHERFLVDLAALITTER
jgi:hypothetical protein